MKIIRAYVLAMALAVSAAACTAEQPTEQPAKAAEETVFDPMLQSLDKAKAVEDQVADQAEKLRARIAAETDGVEIDEP